MSVSLVKKEEITSLIVIAQPVNSITEPEAPNVIHVPLNAKPVLELPETVLFVPETELTQPPVLAQPVT